METRYVIRIVDSDMAEAGLRMDDHSIGQTGIPCVDFRHRDMMGTSDQFQSLVKIILHRLREGEDRVRRIGAAQDGFALHEFLGRPTTEIPTRTRELITCLLNNSAVPEPNIALAGVELDGIDIPHETVSLRAFCLAETTRNAASPVDDWNLALNQLRSEYRIRYPHLRHGP